MGFLRLFSTAIRVEKVRTLRMEGPASLSASDAAMGAIIVLISWVERSSTMESEGVEGAYSLCIFPGSALEGKEEDGRGLSDPGLVFSLPNPPSSLVPSPSVVRTDAR